ncbi:Putative transcriptional regulatory protein ResD [Aneurinibacillus migulanus]|nr:Putative transcriptional regulatory protein ResD [Aneurinibacillus migulanus]
MRKKYGILTGREEDKACKAVFRIRCAYGMEEEDSVNGTKVLVADDDVNVLEIIRLYFAQQQIDLVEAHNGEEAVRLAEAEKPDAIILDVMMPKMDGYEACREIRKIMDTPIIMLSAKGEEFDRVLGLELGADDYVTKPFSPRELVARIKAIFRRMQPRSAEEKDTAPNNALQFQDLHIDLQGRQVTIAGEKVQFRPKEFDLLVFLARSQGSVFTREQLLEQIWGYDFFGDIRTVDVHVKKIRQHLAQLPYECIHTVWGVGYKFEVEASCSA